MKYLLTVLMCLFVVVGCGADEKSLVDPDCPDCLTQDGFFDAFYADCLALCEDCQRWTEFCTGENTYDVNLCAEKRWFHGSSNLHCSDATVLVNEWLLKEECENGYDWKCIDFN
jgi:hypothetical protein